MYTFEVKYLICNSNKDIYHNGRRVNGTGFMSVFGTKGKSFMGPSFDIGMFFHDTFEHMLECSELFNTPELSILGEAVALGIRGYLYENTSLVEAFAGYSKNQGVHLNSIGLLYQLLLYHESEYPLFEDFYVLDEWEENIEPIPCEEQLPIHVNSKVLLLRRAYNYGMWLAEYKLYDKERVEKVRKFMLNYIEFSTILGLSRLDTYETFYPSKFQGSITVTVGNEVEAIWSNREGREMLLVSSDTNVNKAECITNFCKAIGAEDLIKSLSN